MSACFTAAAFSGVQSSSCPKFNNPDALILLVSFVCCLFLLLFLLLSFLATAHLLVKFAPIVLLEEIDVSPALAWLKKAVRILSQVLSYTKSPLFEDERYSIRDTKTFFASTFFRSKVLSHLRNDTREKEERFYA
jgi:hypothetical protein